MGLNLTNHPLISNDGQMTFIDEEDEDEDTFDDLHNELELFEKKEIVEEKLSIMNTSRPDNKIELLKEKNIIEENLNETDSRNEILTNSLDYSHRNEIYERDNLNRDSQEQQQQQKKNIYLDKANSNNKLKLREGFVEKSKHEKRGYFFENKLSKIEEHLESCSIEEELINEFDKRLGKEGEVLNSKDSKRVEIVKDGKVVHKEVAENINDYRTTETNESHSSRDKYDGKYSKVEQSKLRETEDIFNNSLVPINNELRQLTISEPKTNTTNAYSVDQFYFDEQRTNYQDDSLLYLHEYLKTYIENNYEIMRAMNKKDKYLNHKIKINNNKHNRKHVKNILACKCGGRCHNSKKSTEGILCSKYESDKQIIPSSKSKFVWFEDEPATDEEVEYRDENVLEELTEEEFDDKCEACLEEKRNMEIFDTSCLECIEEYRQKFLKNNSSTSKTNHLKSETSVKNKALKLIYDSKRNIPKRSTSEIVCKNLKQKYERNAEIRKKTKRHGIRFDLSNQLAPISYERLKEPKTSEKSQKHRRYSEELLYTAYLDLELRKKFPNLSKVNNRVVNRSSSLMASTPNHYSVPSHSKHRYKTKNTHKRVEKSASRKKTSVRKAHRKNSSHKKDDNSEYEKVINRHIRELTNADFENRKSGKITPKNEQKNGHEQKSPKLHKTIQRNNSFAKPEKSQATECEASEIEFKLKGKTRPQETKENSEPTKNVTGKDLLHQQTNPLIERLFEKQRTETDIDFSPSTSPDILDPDHKSPENIHRKSSLKKKDSQYLHDVDRPAKDNLHDHNNNASKEDQVRQSRVLDNIFENQKNTVEEFRTMCNNIKEKSQSFDSHINNEESFKQKGTKSRKLFSFNFKKKTIPKNLEPNLERPTSLQNLNDISDRKLTAISEDYRRPSNSLQKLNEQSVYQNWSIFSLHKSAKQRSPQSMLERPSSLQKLHDNFTKTHIANLTKHTKESAMNTNLVRQKSASLDQFHGNQTKADNLTRNVSFLHNRKPLAHSFSNDGITPDNGGDRRVKRSKSLMQKLLPLRRKKNGTKKQREDQIDSGKDLEKNSSSIEDRRQMPLPELPYDMPDPDYTTDSHEGIYEELLDPALEVFSPSNRESCRTSPETGEVTSRPPPIPRKVIQTRNSEASSSCESSGASSGYCTKITTPDVDYYTDREESLVYDIPRSMVGTDTRSTVDTDGTTATVPSNSVQSSLSTEQDCTDETSGTTLTRNSSFFLDYVDSLDANKLRTLRSSYGMDPEYHDSLESSCSSDNDLESQHDYHRNTQSKRNREFRYLGNTEVSSNNYYLYDNTGEVNNHHSNKEFPSNGGYFLNNKHFLSNSYHGNQVVISSDEDCEDSKLCPDSLMP
ncbi:hypothetical protein WDU94_003311 [Cyamophila willieti]